MASAWSGSILGLLEETLPACGERLRALARRARAGGDEELVHDLRVALRRTEALARLFRDTPGKGDGEALRSLARDLRRRLSVLRTEEVGRALLASRAEMPDSRLPSIVFPGDLPAVRVDAAEVAAVERELGRWRRRLASVRGAFAPRASARKEVLRRTRRRLIRLVRQLLALLPPDRRTLHDARIAAKRVRYALEVVAPLHPRAGPLLRRLGSFQDAAGDSHDFAELAERLGAVAAEDGALDLAVTALTRQLETDAERAFASARKRGVALEGPIRRLRRSLGKLETR